jgi:hypothetical protein
MDIHEFIVYLLAAIAYFVPFYIAIYRKVNGRQLIFWFNLFFAWTLIAWVLLIVVSLSLRTEHHNKHSVIL